MTTVTTEPRTESVDLVPPEPEPASAASRDIRPRAVAATAFPVLAAAVMIGGVFTGASGRVYATVAGLLGVALAVLLTRTGRTWVVNVGTVGGLFAVGLVMAVPAGLDAVTGLRALVTEAAASGDVLRPPVDMTPGWQAVIGWLMGTAGFASAWMGVALARPSLALLVPLPLVAIGAISVPGTQQLASGLVALVLFAAGLGLLTSLSAGGDERLPLAFEIRRLARGVPLVGVVTALLYVLSRSSFLFPAPLIDPTQEPQKPKTIPLSEVEDRVLFEVRSSISGPWRIGTLDVYDGADWRLPPFSEGELVDVPDDGVVNPDLDPGVKAEFTVAGMSGNVLPGLPNTVGIVAAGRYVYDARSGSVRVEQGQLEPGLVYTVAAAALPSVDELRRALAPIPADVARFAEIGDPPPAVRELLAGAPRTSRWDTFQFIHDHVLNTVTAAGQGVPTSVTADRVQDILAGSREASPFEIVAAEAMLARWAGIPSRIAYGFDGGDLVDDVLQVRPKHGATFLEVYFPGHGWLPIIGTPKKARASIGDTDPQQVNPAVLPSDDIAVEMFLPVVTPPRSTLTDNLVRLLLVVAPAIALVALLYFVYPLWRKSVLRGRRRAAAIAAGPNARIAAAYAEWRDLVTDFGYAYPADTPLMFLERFPADDEHTQLAWLVTRSLWGDLRATEEEAVIAEELSRALRRRLRQGHTMSLRVIAAISRLSMRGPFAPTPQEPARAR